MLYGIVYEENCVIKAYKTFQCKLINESDAYAEKENLSSELNKKFPKATDLRVNTSKSDYGSSATNICVIKWQVKGYKCNYEFAAAYFGKSESEALNKAIFEKNKFAGKNASYTILEQIYW
jgi:hypothetical protein